MNMKKRLMMAAVAACALTGIAAERRMDYPDYMRRWPQLKGVMLGSSTEKEFQDLRDMGATLVRYQMHGSWHQFTNSTDDVAAFSVWMDKQLDHLAEMLVWGRKYGIKICVDQHTHIGGFTDEKYSSDMIFVEKKYEDALVASWEKIARRFKGNTDAIYGYDLFNEPINRENALVKRSWHDVFCRVIEAIRAIDSDTPIIVEPNCNASPRGFDIKNPYGLKGVDLLPYDNLIYSVHVYQPMGFTHQGLFQKKEDYKPKAYPSANAKADPNRKRYPGDLGEDTGKAEVWDKELVRKEIQSVRDFQLRHGVRIFVGEFSAAAYAPGAEKYIEDLCDLFLEYGWDWTYHAFRESTCWSFEHEGPSFYELKKTEKKTRRQEILEKYMKDNRIQGFVADRIVYPERLSPGKRFRGSGIPYPNELKGIPDQKALGMNMIRCGIGKQWPCDKGGRALPTNDETLRQYGENVDRRVEYVKKVLATAAANGMKVALTGPKPGPFVTREKYGEHAYFQDPEMLAAFVSAWRRIARSLKGTPNLYGYDIVNEPLNREYPNDCIHWRDFMILVARTIREEDPDATLIVEANADGSPAGFDTKSRYGFVAMTPIPFDNVIYSVHVYQPMGFTHQGIGKKKEEYRHHSYPTGSATLDLNRKRFPGDLEKDTGTPEVWDKEYVRNAIKGVREFQLKYGARIWVGEFSAASWTDGGDRYLKDLTDLFEEYGWDWSYHSFRENVIWSLEHEGEENSHLLLAKGETPRMKVMKAKWALNNGALRVGTYNIRFQCGTPGSDDYWPDRRDDLARVLKEMNLDVFGLQEVCPGQLDDLKRALPEYAFVGDHREADRKTGEASPVAYRQSRFEEEQKGTFWLSETPDVPASKSWNTACTRVCSYLVLRDKEFGNRFCFANTHTDHVSELAREKGLLLVIERMKTFGKGLPMIFTGDHNCYETDSPARAVAKVLDNALYRSEMPPKGSWRTWNAWHWCDTELSSVEAIKLAPDVRNGKVADGSGVNYGERIDYIYVTPGTRVLDYETVNDCRRGSKKYPSDHFPIAATIVLP